MSRAGKVIRAYVATCASCYIELTLILRDGKRHLVKRTAEHSLRNFDGWSKTKHGWQCTDCVRKKRIP